MKFFFTFILAFWVFVIWSYLHTLLFDFPLDGVGALLTASLIFMVCDNIMHVTDDIEIKDDTHEQ